MSSQNAVRHGVLSGSVTVAGEEAPIYDRLFTGLMSEFDPQTEMERLLVERLTLLFWRERRLVDFERLEIANSSGGITMGATPIGPTLSIANQLLIGRYQTMLSNQAASTIHQLQTVQSARREVQTVEARAEPGAARGGDLPPARRRTRPNH